MPIIKPHTWISLHPFTKKVFLYHKRLNRMLKTEFRWDPQKWWFKSPILAKYQKRSNSPKNLHIACFQHSEWYGNVNWLKRKRLGHRGAHHTLFTPLKDIPISITFSFIRKPSLKRIGWVFPKQSRNLTQWPPFHSSSHVVQHKVFTRAPRTSPREIPLPQVQALPKFDAPFTPRVWELHHSWCKLVTIAFHSLKPCLL